MATPPFERSVVEKFFSSLWFVQKKFVELRLIAPNGEASSRFCTGEREAVEVAAGASGNANVYVGASPRSRCSGSRDAIDIVVAAWADLDFHQIDPDRDLALELAYRRLESLDAQPTILVHTGNGLQAWWLYEFPRAITTEWPVERFEAINRGIAERIGGDHVHDLPRVLRVPGTMNLPSAKKRERGCRAILARLLKIDGPRHAPESFQRLAGLAPVNKVPGIDAIPRSDIPDPDVAAAFERLLHRLGPHHPLTRTWEGRRQPKDSTRSGFDWALALSCARVGVKPGFVWAVLRQFRHGKGGSASDAYLERTIGRAYASIAQRRRA